MVHSHYSLSAFAASIACSSPLVVSLMGSDVKSDYIFRLFIYLFNLISWKRIIVKSPDMKSSLNISSAIVVPNGVDLSLFKPLNKNLCKKKLNWSLKKNKFYSF